MSSKLPGMVPPLELRHHPLFKSLSDAQLAELLALFEERSAPAGHVLFREGDAASEVLLLVDGEVELAEAGEPKLVLSPPAPIGELGALAGLKRHTTAVTKTPARWLAADASRVVDRFAQSKELALAFHRALLEVVALKVRRDRARIDDMRANIVRTQKRMKELRELVLSSPETPISQAVCEGLEDLIEHNRRAHYRVSPTVAHPASARIGDRVVRVLELSAGYLKLEPSAGLAMGAETTAVLVLPQGEIAISGRVSRIGADGAVIRLDLLIGPYERILLGYITQLQLLDFVV
jgi:CRP/FNR family cyclic AMP-dependent transcriptional regulator